MLLLQRQSRPMLAQATPRVSHGASRRQSDPILGPAGPFQFQADTAVEQGQLPGRVEHVVSGQATAFQSLVVCYSDSFCLCSWVYSPLKGGNHAQEIRRTAE